MGIRVRAFTKREPASLVFRVPTVLLVLLLLVAGCASSASTGHSGGVNFHPLTAGAGAGTPQAAATEQPAEQSPQPPAYTPPPVPDTAACKILAAADPAQALPQASLPAGVVIYEQPQDAVSWGDCSVWNDDPNGGTSNLMSSSIELRLYCDRSGDAAARSIWAGLRGTGSEPMPGSAPGAIHFQASSWDGEGVAARAADGCVLALYGTPRVAVADEGPLLARVADAEAAYPQHPPA